MRNLIPILMIVWVGGFLWYSCIAIWLAFGITELRLDRNLLTINKKILGFSEIKRIDATEIISFCEFQEPGRGWDSLLGWGLKVTTSKGKKVNLVSRQQRSISDWLGRLAASTYQVKLLTADE